MKFEDLYKSNELINICKKITGNHCMTDDLYQEVLLCLLEYNPSKLKDFYNTKVKIINTELVVKGPTISQGYINKKLNSKFLLGCSFT